MAEKEKARVQSKFNFFAILEDTITDVIEFVLRFIGVTLLCLFRPQLCIARYREAETLPAGIFPRPYTYLVLCVFIFIKGFYWISQSTLKGPESPTSDDSFLIKIHEFVGKLGDISTLQIILSVFPTIVVILFLSLLVTLLHRPFVDTQYRQASHVFSYIFGAQIVGALVILALFVGAARWNVFGTGIYVAFGLFISGAIALVITSTGSLKAWFDIHVIHRLAKFGLYLFYAVIVILITFAYFSTIVAAYSKLESSESSVPSTQKGALLTGAEDDKDFVLTVYHVTSENHRLTLSMLLQNKGERPYFLHDKASAMIMNISPDQLEQLVSPDGPAQAQQELAREYLRLLAKGYARVDLALQEKFSHQEHLIRPGEQRLVSYQAPLAGIKIVNQAIGGVISLPVARFNANGSLSYMTISQELGVSSRDLYTKLDNEKLKADKEIDEDVARLQKVFSEIREKLDRAREEKKGAEIKPE